MIFRGNHGQKSGRTGQPLPMLSQRRRTQKLPLFCQWQKLLQLSLAHCFFCHLVFQVCQNVVAKLKMCLKRSAHFKQVLHIPRILNIRKTHRHELQTSKGGSGRPAVQKMRSDTSNFVFCPPCRHPESNLLFSPVDPALAQKCLSKVPAINGAVGNLPILKHHLCLGSS